MTDIILLIFLNAIVQGVNPHLALSVALNESSLNPYAEGTSGDIGLFQVRHELVNETKQELFNVQTNINAGLRILKSAESNCRFKKFGFVVCYNRGIAGGKKINYSQDKYYKKIFRSYSCLKKYNLNELVSKSFSIIRECKK